MHRPWKTFVIVFMAFWLPLQGYAAVAMPFCERNPVTRNSTGATDAHVGHVPTSQKVGAAGAHANHAGIHADEPKGKHKTLGCNGCSPCHLACAPTIAVAPLPMIVVGTPTYDPPFDVAMTSVSPKRLQRPPRPALS